LAKIFKFPFDEKDAITPTEFLHNTMNVIDDNTESIVIACKNKDGTWLTGYFEADRGTRNEALGHIQADIIDQMIKSNPERYGE
jgi:hypothetical protein